MLTFHLEESVLIGRKFCDFPPSFADPRSLAAWDTSVARVEITSDGPVRVGFTYDTIGPRKHGREGKRSSYRITRLEPRENSVELINSTVFRRAVWGFRFEDIPEGTLTTCTVDLEVKRRYFVVALMLRFNRRALVGDLRRLKRAIEEQPQPPVSD